MEIYQQERCSKKQKQKIRETDRKRAAETRLQKKMEQESIRQKSQKKSIQKKFQLPLRYFKNLSPRCVMLQKILSEK